MKRHFVQQYIKRLTDCVCPGMLWWTRPTHCCPPADAIWPLTGQESVVAMSRVCCREASPTLSPPPMAAIKSWTNNQQTGFVMI